MNHLTLSGYVGNDPKITTNRSKIIIVNFSLGVKQKNGSRYGTAWHYITAFGDYSAKRIKKGVFVVVRGILKESTYTQNGQKKRSLNVVAFSVEVVEPKKKPVQPITMKLVRRDIIDSNYIKNLLKNK